MKMTFSTVFDIADGRWHVTANNERMGLRVPSMVERYAHTTQREASLHARELQRAWDEYEGRHRRQLDDTANG
jgi:hypothetical protein